MRPSDIIKRINNEINYGIELSNKLLNMNDDINRNKIKELRIIAEQTINKIDK